jgi:ATP synthase protein I
MITGKARQIIGQIGIGGLVAATIIFAWWLTYGGQLIGSLLLGVLLWALPNFYFARKVFSQSEHVPAASLLRIFYRAELVKLLLSGILFVMIIKLILVNIPVVLVGYFASQLIFLVCLILNNKEALA